MCVATAVIVGVGAASSIYAAKKGADAAHEAADVQSKSATEARNLQEQRYQQSRQDFNPYQQAGATSLARLGGMANQPRQQFNGWRAGGGFQMPQQPAQQAPQAMQTPGMPQTAPSPAMQAVGIVGGKMVTLRAPDGSTQQFPELQVPQVLAAAQAKGHALQVVG